MNKQIKTWTASLLAVSIIGSAGFVMADGNLLGAKAAAEDKSHTLQEMLNYAIQDEYLAKSEYAAIIDAFDVTRPYTNIIRAEENHIAQLLPLLEANNVQAPSESTFAGQAVIPGTLAETYALGVEAEQDNIAMYETFLKQDLPEDVREVFENLRNGSIKHLSVFDRTASNEDTNAFAGNRSGRRINGNMGLGNQGIRNSQAGNNSSGNGSAASNDGTRIPETGWSNRVNQASGYGRPGKSNDCILA